MGLFIIEVCVGQVDGVLWVYQLMFKDVLLIMEECINICVFC